MGVAIIISAHAHSETVEVKEVNNKADDLHLDVPPLSCCENYRQRICYEVLFVVWA